MHSYFVAISHLAFSRHGWVFHFSVLFPMKNCTRKMFVRKWQKFLSWNMKNVQHWGDGKCFYSVISESQRLIKESVRKPSFPSWRTSSFPLSVETKKILFQVLPWKTLFWWFADFSLQKKTTNIQIQLFTHQNSLSTLNIILFVSWKIDFMYATTIENICYEIRVSHRWNPWESLRNCS